MENGKHNVICVESFPTKKKKKQKLFDQNVSFVCYCLFWSVDCRSVKWGTKARKIIMKHFGECWQFVEWSFCSLNNRHFNWIVVLTELISSKLWHSFIPHEMDVKQFFFWFQRNKKQNNESTGKAPVAFKRRKEEEVKRIQFHFDFDTCQKQLKYVRVWNSFKCESCIVCQGVRFQKPFSCVFFFVTLLQDVQSKLKPY